MLHRIDQAGAVDEVGLPALDHCVIFRQQLRRHRQIGIQDHQHVAGRRGKALADRIALALALLFQDLDVPAIPRGIANPLAFLKCAVAGISLDEQNLLSSAESRHPQNSVLDIAFFVPAGNDDAHRELAIRELLDGAPDEISSQAQLPDPRQRRDESVDERSEAEPAPRQQLSPLFPDHLEIRQIHQVQEIGGGDVVDFRLLAAQMQRFGELQHRLPQMRIIGDDDPRRRGAEMMHQS